MIGRLPGLPQSAAPAPARGSLADAIRAYLPSYSPRVVFDVGANIGQSARWFASLFPQAAIYAFEPLEELHRVLASVATSLPKTQVFRLALGDAPGEVTMAVDPRRPTEGRVTTDPALSGERLVTVQMETGDRFCAARSIEHIGLLKIDAEGHDLKVLKGFSKMLSQGAIDLAEAEVGMNRFNTKHVPLEDVRQFMDTLDYDLFYIYEQVLDVAFSGRPILRRANVVFISPKLAELHSRHRN